MRFLFLTLAITACGSQSKSDNAATPPKAKPEVARVNLEAGFCPAGVGLCAINVGSDISDGSSLFNTTYKFATSFAVGPTAPAACDGTSRVSDIGNEKILVSNLNSATAYSFRGCIFDAADGSYTPGVVASLTTPQK